MWDRKGRQSHLLYWGTWHRWLTAYCMQPAHMFSHSLNRVHNITQYYLDYSHLKTIIGSSTEYGCFFPTWMILVPVREAGTFSERLGTMPSSLNDTNWGSEISTVAKFYADQSGGELKLSSFLQRLSSFLQWLSRFLQRLSRFLQRHGRVVRGCS
jgi:hypothetical protein